MPRIYYVCHSIPSPRGGIRVMYHHVEHLVTAGFDAAMVHFEPNFRLTWFDVRVPVIDGNQRLSLEPDDWIVLPEDYGAAFTVFRNVPCHKAVLCQNHYAVFEILEREAHYRDFGVEVVIAASRATERFCREVFGLPTVFTPTVIDHTVFRPDPSARRLQVAFMPRKGAWNARMVMGMLHHKRVDLRDIPFVPLDGMPAGAVAQALRESSVFLSTSHREGFGIPPLEAMASGCVVAGFTGGGGTEYATGANGFWVPDEDPLTLATTLERVLSELRRDARALDGVRDEAIATASRYTLAWQRELVVGFWRDAFTRPWRGDSSVAIP